LGEQSTIDHLYHDGRRYDRIFAATEDLPFWSRLAAQQGGPILELACGTGRVTIALAQQGLRVTGLDNAAAMLAEAARKGVDAGVDVTWVAADMRHFALHEIFALIILPANTLCHLLTTADFVACMACVKQHLAPNGRFVIDVFVPRMELLVNRPGERFPFAEYEDPDGRGPITVTESYTYEPDTQIKRITTHQQMPDGTEFAGKLNMRMYFPQELDALLRYNGFVIEKKYGAYNRAPFDRHAEKQLLICTAG
jgi:SAM-dependent methyltransferase